MAWKVISQQEQTVQGQDGRFGPGVRVTFQVDGGATGTVDVPHAQYNAEMVRMLIEAKVAHMGNIAGLSG